MAETRSSTDYEIQHAVMKRLDWAADVRSEHIGVGVTDGAVTITGEVVDQKERLAAIRAASEVRGVDAVVDEIVVQWAGVVSNDVDVARKVQEAIERVQGRAPTVVGLVRNGIVTLTGVIEDDEQRVVLRDAIAAQPGIGPVVDRMSELPTPSAAEVRALVAEVGTRHASGDRGRPR